MTEKKMIERCQEMMEHKRNMKAVMKAQDAELTEQLVKMSSAPEDKEMNLMAAVITRVVEQRDTRDARKTKMEEAMMQHMMHMMRRMQMDKEAMPQCPMMKGMEGVDEHAGSAHNGHQEGQQ